MNALTNTMRTVLIAGVALAALAGLSGCDDYGMNSMMNGWYGGYGDWGYPDYGLYDPTDTIQSVVDYRLEAMDTAASGWDEYIWQ